MQTFLPDPSFHYCATTLDGKRLNKQRIECIQIMNAFDGGGWSNHPAVRMWRPYRDAFVTYWEAIEQECRDRGYKAMKVPNKSSDFLLPPWIGDDRLHSSHRLNLLYKNSDHYTQWFTETVPTMKPDYFWPTQHKEYND